MVEQIPEMVPPPETELTPTAEPLILPDPLDGQANAIITAGVAATVGMGWVPAFVDIGWLIVANSGMITALAVLYHHKWTADNTKNLIGRLIGDSGIAIVSVKALAALLDMTGIGLPVGIAINGALNGGITLALGKSAQHYFKNQGEIPDDELIKFFKQNLALFSGQKRD